MPITLPSLSRRHFLGASAAALAASYAWAKDSSQADPHRFILMADTHIHAQPEFMARDINMTDHLTQSMKGVLALPKRASAAFVLGDLAFNEGKAEDYAQFVKLIEPVRAAGLPVHLLLGNHDHRERFWKGLPADDAREQSLAAKHVLRVKTPRANWFLLDSLDQTNKTPGILGKEQLEWLTKELDASQSRPAADDWRADRHAGALRRALPTQARKGVDLRSLAQLGDQRAGRSAPREPAAGRLRVRQSKARRLRRTRPGRGLRATKADHPPERPPTARARDRVEVAGVNVGCGESASRTRGNDE
jgi:hypothetical protein